MTRRARAALVLALGGLLGAGPLGNDCGGSRDWVELGFGASVVQATVGEPFTVHVRAELAPHALQAFELGVAPKTPGVVEVAGAEPHADFDDDGTLFLPPLAGETAGGLARIVDLRHGAPAASGTTRLVRLEIEPTAPGEAVLRLQPARLAAPDGTALPVAKSRLTVQVAP